MWGLTRYAGFYICIFGKQKIVTKGTYLVVVVVPCVVSSSIWDHLKNKQQESFLDIPDVPNGSPETCSTCQLVYDLTNLYLHAFMYLYVYSDTDSFYAFQIFVLKNTTVTNPGINLLKKVILKSELSFVMTSK